MSPQNAQKWELLADELRAQIAAGTYPVGSTLPRQLDVASERGWSENTVRKAYSALQAEGLVTSIRNRGTIVNKLPHLSGRDRADSVRATGKIYQAGEYARITSADLTEAPAEVAQVLGIEEGSPAIKRVRVTFGPDDSPRSASTSWYDGAHADAAPLLLATERIKAGSWRYLEEQVGIRATTGRETISARLATAEDAELLGLQLPAAVKESVTVLRADDGTVVEYGVSIASEGRTSSFNFMTS
jgi:GntR family transcriptional regulator